MKIKSFFKNPWIIAIGSTGICYIFLQIFQWISQGKVFPWMGKQIKFFFTFSLPFKLWFCVLIVLVLISVILLLFFINKKIRLISNTKSPKEPILKIPDFVNKYKEQIFGPILYKWNWIKTSNEIFPYDPVKIKNFCPKCNCELVQIVSGYRCPVCNTTYGVKDINTVKALIRHKVENNLWKEENKKLLFKHR